MITGKWWYIKLTNFINKKKPTTQPSFFWKIKKRTRKQIKTNLKMTSTVHGVFAGQVALVNAKGEMLAKKESNYFNGGLSVTQSGDHGVLYNSTVSGNTVNPSSTFMPLKFGRKITIFGKIISFEAISQVIVDFHIYFSNDGVSFYKSSLGPISFDANWSVLDGTTEFSRNFDCSAPFVRLEASHVITADMYYSIRS